jgi:hypothetical protein
VGLAAQDDYAPLRDIARNVVRRWTETARARWLSR